jgi:hypothetical protein
VADDQQETAYQLAYQQAERAITQQAGALDEIRAGLGRCSPWRRSLRRSSAGSCSETRPR